MTLELWSHPENDAERSCCSPSAVLGARALAHSMGIPHFTLDLRDEFRAAVVDDFLAEYEAGRTPNPCVRCNGMVRFDGMLALAEPPRRCAPGHRPLRPHPERRAGAAGGGGRRSAQGPELHARPALARRAPASAAFRSASSRSTQVRALARAAGLPVADKRESQDLCFLAGVGAREFLRRHGGPARPGRARGPRRADRAGATAASASSPSASVAAWA